MNSGAAFGLGVGLGVFFPVAVLLWIVVRGSLASSVGYVAFGLMFVVVGVGAILAGSFRSAIIFTLGFGVGIALSSVVTFPLGALAKKRHGQGSH